MLPKPGYAINIPIEDWEDTMDGRLLTTIYINQVAFHLEAIEVKTNKQGIQCAANQMLMGDYYENLAAAHNPAGSLHEIRLGEKNYAVFIRPFLPTVIIEGKRYVIFGHPHSQ